MLGCRHVTPEIRFDLAQNPGDNVGWATLEEPLERFIRRENIKHYQELLKRVKDEAERQRILKLLAEEREEQKAAGDKIEE
jgi:hypothetical protein